MKMNKTERRKLANKIVASIEKILSQYDKKASPQTKKQVKAASKQLVKKFNNKLKKNEKGRKPKIKKIAGKTKTRKKTSR
jgi:hypothetical protein